MLVQVIVQARKPDFFNHAMSLYEVVTEDGLMKPCMTAVKGGLYCGGSARMVEVALNVSGDEILYVGDHLYTDAALAKINFRSVVLTRHPFAPGHSFKRLNLPEPFSNDGTKTRCQGWDLDDEGVVIGHKHLALYSS